MCEKSPYIHKIQSRIPLNRTPCAAQMPGLLKDFHVHEVLTKEHADVFRKHLYGARSSRSSTDCLSVHHRSSPMLREISLSCVLNISTPFMSEPGFRICFANMKSRKGIILAAQSLYTSRPVNLLCFGSKRQGFVVAPVPRKGSTTISQRLVNLRNRSPMSEFGFCSGRNIGRLPDRPA